jgi:hypothetical protein
MKLSVTLKYNSDMAYESIWHRLRHDFGTAAPFWQSDVAANSLPRSFFSRHVRRLHGRNDAETRIARPLCHGEAT